MRVTKPWLKQVKDRIQARAKELRNMSHPQLKAELKKVFPGRSINTEGCPNCGSLHNCKCRISEVTMAASDLTVQACTYDLMIDFIEKVIPNTLTD